MRYFLNKKTQSNQNNTHRKRSFDYFPVWQSAMLFLVIFLTLESNPGSAFASDNSLYAEQIPAHASFARVVYFGNNSDPNLEVELDGKAITLSANKASDYVLMSDTSIELMIGELNHQIAAKPKDRISIALGYDAHQNTPVVLGQIVRNTKVKKTKKSNNKNKKKRTKSDGKARLHLYNFNPQNPMHLQTVKGGTKIIRNVRPNQHSFREVNPITIALQVTGKNMEAVSFDRTNLKARDDYSFFVHKAGQVIFTRDDLLR